MLTNEMIKKSQYEHGYKGFTIIDDNYIVIEGNELDISWIEKTKELRRQGVNYCGPIDYKIKDGVIYLLEYRAPGMEVDLYREYLGRGNTYLSEFNKYLAKLRILNNAPLEQLMHFFDDIEKMRSFGLKPDVCSLSNLFYDEKVGFSFIDVYPGDEQLDVFSIFTILINPKFSISGISLLPLESQEEYNFLITNLYAKIASCLKRFGYPQEDIEEYLKHRYHNFTEDERVPASMINETFKERRQDNCFTVSLL